MSLVHHINVFSASGGEVLEPVAQLQMGPLLAVFNLHVSQALASQRGEDLLKRGLSQSAA